MSGVVTGLGAAKNCVIVDESKLGNQMFPLESRAMPKGRAGLASAPKPDEDERGWPDQRHSPLQFRYGIYSRIRQQRVSCLIDCHASRTLDAASRITA
jgi:hypothetical protein